MESPNCKQEPPSPSKLNRDELEQLSEEKLVQRVIELESELNEFQESSKELEQALEEELQGLENENSALREALGVSKEQLQISKVTISNLNKEMSDLNETVITKTQEYEKQISSLKQKLVSVEIVNDDMEENDRMLCNKLELAGQFNNELLEKIAIIENDIHRERQTNSQKQLHITNFEITIKELNDKVSSLETKLKFYENNEVESLFLSMKDILNAGPPSSKNIHALSHGRGSGMKKSDSLKKLHQLTTDSESMSRKARNLKNSVYTSHMKSLPTTKLSRHTSKATLRGKLEDKENIEPYQKTKTIPISPLIMDISSTVYSDARDPQGINKPDQFQTSQQALEAVKGSPTMNNKDSSRIPKIRHVKRRHRRTNIFDTFKSLSLSNSN